MSKQQAIEKLQKEFGVTDIVPHGKYCIEATVTAPGSGKQERGLFDPRDLLKELQELQARAH